MFIERDNWKLESVNGTNMVLVTHKPYNDERIVSRRVVPDAATLQKMSKEDFERAALGVFLGWDMAKQETVGTGFSRVTASLVGLAIVITLAGFFVVT